MAPPFRGSYADPLSAGSATACIILTYSRVPGRRLSFPKQNKSNRYVKLFDYVSNFPLRFKTWVIKLNRHKNAIEGRFVVLAHRPFHLRALSPSPVRTTDDSCQNGMIPSCGKNSGLMSLTPGTSAGGIMGGCPYRARYAWYTG